MNSYRRCYSILRIFKKPHSPVKLGRWSHAKDMETINFKVDMANHDSCGGPGCSQVPTPAKRKVRADREKITMEEDDDDLRFHTLSAFYLHRQRKA